MIATARIYLLETFANNTHKGELRDSTAKASKWPLTRAGGCSR